MPKKITKDAISGGTDMLFAGMTPKTEQPGDEEKNLKKKTEPAQKKKTTRKKSSAVSKELAPAYVASKEEAERAATKGQTFIVKTERKVVQPAQTFHVHHMDPEEAPAEPEKKKSKAYTLWMDPDTIELLDVYCKTAKKKKVDIIRAAISEYTRRHKVTEEEKAAYQGRTDILG